MKRFTQCFASLLLMASMVGCVYRGGYYDQVGCCGTGGYWEPECGGPLNPGCTYDSCNSCNACGGYGSPYGYCGLFGPCGLGGCLMRLHDVVHAGVYSILTLGCPAQWYDPLCCGPGPACGPSIYDGGVGCCGAGGCAGGCCPPMLTAPGGTGVPTMLPPVESAPPTDGPETPSSSVPPAAFQAPSTPVWPSVPPARYHDARRQRWIPARF